MQNPIMKFIKLITTLIFVMSIPICFADGDSSKVIVFVSFSMPDASLKHILEDAHAVGAPVVIRGLVNNSFKETALKISKLIGNKPYGFQIDPILFKKFSIQQVPAVVVANTTKCVTDHCDSETFDIIYGNVTLSYALSKVSNSSSERSLYAKKMLLLLKDAQGA